MDLKIEDVADLLKVSSTTIRRWLKEGKIPAYKLNHQFRFSKMEIEEWLMECQVGKQKRCPSPFFEKITLSSEAAKKAISSKVGGTQAYSLFRAIYRGKVIDDIMGQNKEEVIRKSVKFIAGDLSLDQDVLADLLLDRERLMSTALNSGLAVPHARDFLIPQSYDMVTTVYLDEPIEYNALDGLKVHTLFFLFACEDKRHIHLLAKLAHFAKDKKNTEFLKTKPNKEDLLNFIKKWEEKLNLKS